VAGGTFRKQIEYTICPDRIVAGTYALAAVTAGGDVLFKEMPLEHMKSTIQVIGKLGAELHRDEQGVRIRTNGKPKALKYVCTMPYPGFPTDLQSPLLAAVCMSDGKSCIEERVFENRFLIVEHLRKMGANVCVIGQTAHVLPVDHLYGAILKAEDLRGGAALVLAALGAEGETIIKNAEVIFRGYEDIAVDLESLGANIRTLS